jgi:phosphonate transport system ATP-binding protein
VQSIKKPANNQTKNPSMSFKLSNITIQHANAKSKALSNISFSVTQGEQIALIGPSGAGKTSLLHTLACALKPSSGELNAFGENPWQLSHGARHTLRSRSFLAPQTPPLPARQRVVNAVLAGKLPQWSLWTALRSLVKPVAAREAFDALTRFDLQDKLYARVDRLSGGERQRCGMARALVSNAQAFLVDEPLSALDPTLSLQTLQVLQQEASQRNATLICSLHQVELALAHFPRIIGLRDGQIVFDAARAEISEAMIEALYRNDTQAQNQSASHDSTHSDHPLTTPLAIPRC